MQIFIKKDVKASSIAPAGCKYPAFISYSHRDEQRARWLHKAIEGYRVPKPLVGRLGRNGPIEKRIFPVFRDEDELAASSGLPRDLRAALSESANLIVLCSPAAAQSRWVNQEIIEFKRLGRADRIIPLIVDGEPHAPSPQYECFPPALRFEIDVAGNLTDQPADEPIAADLRSKDGNEESKREESSRQENAKLKLIAGVLGVSFDELRQRELIAARGRARIWQGIGFAMFVLFVLALVSGVMAWRYGKHAESLLAEAIRISTNQVGAAVRVADQRGVSRKAIADLLSQAKSAFDGLYQRVEDAPKLLWWETSVPARLRGERAGLLLVLADHFGVIGQIGAQRSNAEEARAELASVSVTDPANLKWRRQLARSQDLIADAHALGWNVGEALAGYRDALTIREKMELEDPDDARLQREIGLSKINIGDMLLRQGQWGPSLAAYREALAIEQRLADAEPSDLQLVRDLVIAHQRIGDMLLNQGAQAEAEASFRASLAGAERLAAADPENVQAQRDLSVSLSMLGDALQGWDDREALGKFEASLAIVKPLAASDPKNVGLQRDLFKTYESIGNLRFEQGELPAAQLAFEAALDVAEPPATADPKNNLLQRELSVLRNRLGQVFEVQGRLDAALEEYRQAMETRKILTKPDSTNAQALHDLSLSYEMMAGVLLRQRYWQQALSNYKQSLEIAQKLADIEPGNRQWQRELAIAHQNVAYTLQAQGLPSEALHSYEIALGIVEQLATAHPADVETQRDLSEGYSNLAQFHERRGNRAEARLNYCQAKAPVLSLMKLEPENGEWTERNMWIEEKLKATQDPTSAPC